MRNRKKTGPFATLEILQKFTDDKHLLSIDDIVEHLEKDYGVTADRRTIYDNMGILKEFHYDIDGFMAGHRGYSLHRDRTEVADVVRMLQVLKTSGEFSDAEYKKAKERILRGLSIYQRREINGLMGE